MKCIKIMFVVGLWMFCSLFHSSAQQYRPITFEEYLSEVASNNLEYLAEKYNVRMADAEIAIQKMLPDPELAFEAADEAFSLELGYTLELGKRRSRVRLAKTEAEIEALALDWFFQELRAQAADAFLEAIAQRELLKVKQNSYEYMAQIAQYDSTRYKIGEISENDARQSQLEAATLLNEVYRQQGEYLSSIVMLNQYMGNDTGELFDPSGNLNTIDEPYQLTDLIAFGTDNRVDMVVANKSLEMALQNVRMVKAEKRPDIDVMIGYEREWNGFWPRHRELLKAGVSIPLKFSAFNKGTVRQAEYFVNQNEARAKNTELAIQTEISQAWFRYESVSKQVRQFESGLLEQAEALLEGMTFRYKRGEIDILELLIAQRTHNEVQEQYLETMSEYAASIVELQKSAGIWEVVF